MACRLHARGRIGLAGGILALSWLSAVGVQDARAGPARGADGRDGAVVASPVAGSPGGETRHPVAIPDLLARLEQQVADGRMWAPPGDNAVDTFRAITDLLPNAPEADIRALQALPSHFEARARVAQAAGRDEESLRFLTWAQALATRPGVSSKPSKEIQPEATRLVQPPRPSPNVAPSLQPTPTPKQPLLDVAPLLARGDAALARGQIADARGFYRLAANNGSAKAARRMAQTWDPIYLARHGAVGIQSDPQQAQSWLDRAHQLDSK